MGFSRASSRMQSRSSFPTGEFRMALASTTMADLPLPSAASTGSRGRSGARGPASGAGATTGSTRRFSIRFRSSGLSRRGEAHRHLGRRGGGLLPYSISATAAASSRIAVHRNINRRRVMRPP